MWFSVMTKIEVLAIMLFSVCVCVCVSHAHTWVRQTMILTVILEAPSIDMFVWLVG